MANKIVIPVSSSSTNTELVPSRIVIPVSSSSTSTEPAPSLIVIPVSSSYTSTESVPSKIVIPVSSSSSSSASTEEEVTSQPKKREHRSWYHDNLFMILKTMAALRRRNVDILPEAQETLKVLNDGNMLFRRGIHVRELSNEICKLRKKFKDTIAIKPRPSPRRWRLSRNRIEKKLFQESAEVWPELLEAAAN
jgi:hypothetical protein